MCDFEGRGKTNTYEKDAKKHALTHQKVTSTTLNFCAVRFVTRFSP